MQLSDLVKTAITAVITAVITVVGTIYVSTFEYFYQSRELDIKMVDVSLAILRGDKGDEDKQQSVIARTFALRALRKYADVKLKDDELDERAKSGSDLLLSKWDGVDKFFQVMYMVGWVNSYGMAPLNIRLQYLQR